jgi:hypothetical protein
MPPPSGLSWTPLVLRFDGSLESKVDARALAPPSLALAQDVQFEEIGALGTRPPFGSVMGGGAIAGGGSLSSCRKLATVNGELCVFTDTGFYSWNAQLSSWVLRGTHLAVTVDETPRLVTTGDQIDGDRAELAGVIVVAWTEAGQVYAGAIDKVTGSVLVSPTAVSTAVGRPRLVALATKILLFTDAGSNNLTVRAIDPAAPSTALGSAGTTVLAANYNAYYDVTRAGTQDLVAGACRRTTTTSYTVFTVTPALSVVTSTKARACDGPIAASTIPDGTKLQIARGDGAIVRGDLLTTSSLADVFTGQNICNSNTVTPINQITVCHRTIQDGGAFRCYVFCEAGESAIGGFRSRFNWVDSAGTIGTPVSDFVNNCGIASRAFDHAGRVFVWMVFAAVSNTGFDGVGTGPGVQNTLFLFRDDTFLTAKAQPTTAGGYAPSTGRLPGVSAVDVNTYAWCGSMRRQIPLGHDGTGYAARANSDIVITFDSNDARRTAAHGMTLYIAGGEILQYDGVRLVEVGFHVYPHNLSPDQGGAGSLSGGVYAYKVTARWMNARGEQERSTTTTVAPVTITANTGMSVGVMPEALATTHKLAVPIALEFWRTLVNPGVDAPFFLVSSKNPAATGDNGYVANDVTVASIPQFTDALSDDDVSSLETNPENDNVLEFLAPPGAKIIVPTETRLLITGIPGDSDAWFYSRERGDGEIVSFHDELRVEVPPVGGAITALWADDQFVYVARQTALYAFAGPGKANDDSGQNFSLVRTISRDVGVVSQEAHAAAGSLGRLLKTTKGWYLLTGGELRYVGGAVSAFDSDTVLAVHTITAKHQVRILTSSRMLLWDYRGLIASTNQDPGRWGMWSISDGLDAVMWNGTHVYLTASGPRQESATFTGVTYGLDVATGFIKPADLFGAVAVRKVQPLGEYRGDHLLRLRMYYNFDDATVVDDVVWNPSPTVVGGPLQFSHGPRRRNCQSFKVRLTAVTDQARATLATVGMVVATGGAPWAATWRAGRVATDQVAYGELGNRLTMSVAFAEFAGATIAGLPVTLPFNFVSETGLVEVRDHFAWDPDGERWIEDLDNIGVLVAGTVTVAELEAAIAADTALATLAAADGSPGKVIDVAGVPAIGQFTGGAFGAPTGEALKLTGLGLEVGAVTPGLTRRLPGSQHA